MNAMINLSFSKPRCAWMLDGNIEAAFSASKRIVINSRTGDLLERINVTDEQFRVLIRAAREAWRLR